MAMDILYAKGVLVAAPQSHLQRIQGPLSAMEEFFFFGGGRYEKVCLAPLRDYVVQSLAYRDLNRYIDR